jgi:hypothetical protein
VDAGITSVMPAVPTVAQRGVQQVPAAQQQPGQIARPGPGADVYRSTLALVIWWVWAAFAAANLIDLAIQGHDHFALVVVAILLVITGVAFVTGFRPRLTADDEGLVINNPLRNHQVPWGCVESMELGDSLEIQCSWQDGGPRRKKLYGWAVHSPRRSRLKTEIKAQRKVRSAERRSETFSRMPAEAKAAMAKTDAEHIYDALQNRADRARATGATSGPPVSRWDWLALASLFFPVVLLIVVALS